MLDVVETLRKECLNISTATQNLLCLILPLSYCSFSFSHAFFSFYILFLNIFIILNRKDSIQKIVIFKAPYKFTDYFAAEAYFAALFNITGVNALNRKTCGFYLSENKTK